MTCRLCGRTPGIALHVGDAHRYCWQRWGVFGRRLTAAQRRVLYWDEVEHLALALVLP